MIAAIGLLIGVIAGLLLQPTVPLGLQPYLPIAVVAALDAVFGGLRAMLDGIFNDRVFIVSFLSNVVVAALIVFLGDHLGVGAQLSTGVVGVLGNRIFSHVAAIRRHIFKA
jgi:small basic protein